MGDGNNRRSNMTATAAAATIAVGVAAGYGLYKAVEWLFSSDKPQENKPHENTANFYREQLRLPMIRRPEPITPHAFLRNQIIHVVNTVEQCRYSVRHLRTYCDECGVLGFDCKSMSDQSINSKPVALLSLATHSGLCVLIRLSELKHIPAELEEILEDASIIKVGVATYEDAKSLHKDYGTHIAGKLDLRYVAEGAKCSILRKISLAEMADQFLGVSLDKNPYIKRSNWEAPTLTNSQIDYAATNAHVAVELFKHFAKRIEPSKSPECIIENHFVEQIDKDYDSIEKIDQPEN